MLHIAYLRHAAHIDDIISTNILPHRGIEKKFLPAKSINHLSVFDCHIKSACPLFMPEKKSNYLFDIYSHNNKKAIWILYPAYIVKH